MWMSSRNLHASLRLSFMLALAALTGCGGDVSLGKVYGKVTIDGEPVQNAVITFIPEGPGRSGSGRTNEAGEYVAEYSSGSAGALIGPCIVEIRTENAFRSEEIPARYNNKTELKETIKAGKNELNFVLEGKLKTKPRPTEQSR